MNDTLVLVFILIITLLIGINEYRRKQITRRDERIAELEDMCVDKDSKIDVLIKALGKHQLTINEPRRRN